MGACGPPGASRCCARASLRTPSRPHPPLEDALRAWPGLAPGPYVFAIHDGTTNVERTVVRYMECTIARWQRATGSRTTLATRAKRVLKRGEGAARSSECKRRTEKDER